MDWLSDLIKREEYLKKEVAKLTLSGKTEHVRSDEMFSKAIKPRIDDMQNVFNDYLCGRNESERSKMNYEVRIKMPFFSHLRSIYSSSYSIPISTL